ncbi:MAG: ion transporter [Candidatus Nomurabacteria bacterium]|nr:ion transporter [Candidatus Nomurabacteria bacterium]USN87340.1 MAG: ion transporter [Candidatus Nomurabacteria bacterium]
MQEKLTNIVEANWFQRLIIAVIILNAITLGLETAPDLIDNYLPLLDTLDLIFLTIFTLELATKLAAYRLNFFKSGWNNFDFIIIAVSYLPFIEGLSILRSLRILRVLRLLSVVPQFRKVTQAFFDSLSGLSVIGLILLLLFYIGAVMTTKLFGAAFPVWFGGIDKSLFSLFQIMTLESWSSGIARPVMELYPYAWLFFVPFILTTTFITLNLLIGVIVNSMQTLHNDTTDKIDGHLKKQDKEREDLKTQLNTLEKTIRELKEKL